MAGKPNVKVPLAGAAAGWRRIAAAWLVACAMGATTSVAQPVAKVRVGIVFGRIPVADLSGTSPTFPGARVLLESLRQQGWVDGGNMKILWRSAEGDLARMPAIVDELVAKRVDVLAVSGNPQIQAALAKTRTIPIVMMISTAPVKAGLVASLTTPGGNVTGLYSEPDATLNGKRLELLKRAAPQTMRVAFLSDGRVNSMSGGVTPETRRAADALGLVLLPFGVDTHDQLQAAFRDALNERADALLVDTSLSAAFRDQEAFHAFAQRHRLPVMHTYVNAVTTGGLMFYGTDSSETYRLSAWYIDRILRGARPGELPVQQATKYLLVINLRAARAIGLTIPPDLLVQADRVLD